MGLASGKPKLKVIDIQSRPSVGRGFLSSATEMNDRPPTLDPTRSQDVSEIGSVLRNARERMGQDLRDVSRNLRIRHEYLGALEIGEFHTLPGMTYAIGYVRTYAQYLALDADRAVTLFKTEAQELEGPRQLVFPSPAPEGRVPGSALMVVAAILAIATYAGWYYLTNSERNVANYAPPIPESMKTQLFGNETSEPTEGFASTAVASTQTTSSVQTAVGVVKIKVPKPVEQTFSTGDPRGTPGSLTTDTAAGRSAKSKIPISARAASLRAENGTPVSDVGSESSRAVTADQLPAPLSKTPMIGTNSGHADGGSSNETLGAESIAGIPAVPLMSSARAESESLVLALRKRPGTSRSDDFSRDEVNTRIVIRATADSWVQVRAAGSTTIMTRVMRTGDFYEVPNREGLRLFTGNAGALKIMVDGKEIDRIGPIGAIARNVRLDPQTLTR